MKKLTLFLVVAAMMAGVLNSCSKENQNNVPVADYNLGCQFLPAAEYAAIPMAPAPTTDLKGLPTVVNLPCPAVGNQGAEGSCVAWGTTYAGRSIDWYKTWSNTSYAQNTNIFSPEYVYNQIKVSASCASGSYVTSGLNLLQSQGVCTWQSMPYNDWDCSTQPNTTQRTQAANYKISGYSRVAIDANTIKSFLAANKPVIVAGPVNNSFVYLGANQVLGKFTGATLGGHCYCVVGYDNSKSAFKFINSWGTGWATLGYGWISYTNVKAWWVEAYVINTAI